MVQCYCGRPAVLKCKDGTYYLCCSPVQLAEAGGAEAAEAEGRAAGAAAAAGAAGAAGAAAAAGTRGQCGFWQKCTRAQKEATRLRKLVEENMARHLAKEAAAAR